MSMEPELVHQLQHARSVRLRQVQRTILDARLHVAVALQRHQPLRQRKPPLHRLDGLALLRRELVEIREQAIQRTVLRDHGGGRLGSDALGARHIVHRITHQREHVHHLIGPHALALEQCLGVDQLARLSVHKRRVAVEQLTKILVAAHDADGHVRMRGARAQHQRGDGIIRLHLGHGHHGNGEQPAQLHATLHLRREILRRRLTMRLVFGIDGRAEGAAIPRRVDHQHQAVRSLLAQQLQQHAREPEHHVRGLVGDGAGHAAADGVIRAEELRVTVDDPQRVGVAHEAFPTARACSA